MDLLLYQTIKNKLWYCTHSLKCSGSNTGGHKWEGRIWGSVTPGTPPTMLSAYAQIFLSVLPVLDRPSIQDGMVKNSPSIPGFLYTWELTFHQPKPISLKGWCSPVRPLLVIPPDLSQLENPSCGTFPVTLTLASWLCQVPLGSVILVLSCGNEQQNNTSSFAQQLHLFPTSWYKDGRRVLKWSQTKAWILPILYRAQLPRCSFLCGGKIEWHFSQHVDAVMKAAPAEFQFDI